MKYLLKPLSKSGMSLIEVMIIVYVMSLLMVGLSGIFFGMAARQKMSESKNGVIEFSKNLQQVLKDEANWQATVSHPTNAPNTNLSCLSDATANCTGGASTNFNVYLQGGAPYYLSATPTQGFDYTGAQCNTFPAEPCVFRFNLQVITQCLSNCARPQVTIIGNIQKNITIDNPILRTIDDRIYPIAPPPNPPNPLEVIPTVSFRISRGERSRYETFELSQSSGAVANPVVGACTSLLSWNNVRPLDTLAAGAPPYVTFNNATDTFTLPPGVYECDISAQGYDQVDGFKIRLADLNTATNSQVIGSARTLDDSSAIISGKIKLQLSRVPSTSLQLQQYCVSHASTDVSHSMGRPIPPFATPSIFTKIFCSRTQ